MPTYEYECGNCSHRFEEWQKITAASLKKCPKCGKHKLERLISAPAFHLKGGGWYSDLYSSSKPESTTKKSDSSKSSSNKSGSSTKKKPSAGAASEAA